MTSPFDPKISALITGSLRHESKATAYPRTGDPFELDLEQSGYSITFAENWAPYAQASIECAVPDQASLDRLDPRLLCRVRLEAGYTYPDNQTEIYPLADVGLRARDVKRPADVMTLTAESDEAAAQDYVWRTDYPLMPTTGINEAVSWCLQWPFMHKPYSIVSDLPNGTGAADLAELKNEIGDDIWGLLDEIATRTDKRVYCDEAGIWRITNRADVGPAAHSLTVGEAGTILTSDSGLSRDGWYNSVHLDYQWRDGAADYRILATEYSGGIYSPSTVGWKTFIVRGSKPISQLTASRVVQTKLKKLLSRGRSLTLTAIAAYWLRPGMTVAVTLPTGGTQNHIIESVTFRPGAGLMDITTREPVTVTTTGE